MSRRSEKIVDDEDTSLYVGPGREDRTHGHGKYAEKATARTMAKLTRTCSQGHSWEPDEGSPEGSTTVGEACPICRGMADTLPPDRLPSADTAVHAGRARPWPAVPGYEIEAELGRGGMGVVYRARQTSLRRVVALKMLVDGALASANALGRFRTEAEAVARLAHPNIVQIFETGEAEGRAFFSMEYVDGGSLSDRTHAGPLPPREAARTVATLARAVGYAHEHGVVHRDLKPANVLLTSDGTAKIADFGLAKQLASDARQTYSGDVMGSPSYMAPEQARGATHQIGPACDVYALGGILYEMLTGRPPFLGSDTMETLIQVLHEDPLSPRRLVPRVPRDLETIALKCLDKSPRQRYASAGDVAADVERFLAGRPVVARPAGAAEVAIKWARRRPAVAALVFVSIASLTTILLYGAWKNAQLQTSLAAEQTARRAEQAQRERAENNFRKALDAADRRLTRAGQDPQRLLREELAFYNEIRAQPGAETPVRYERAMAARRGGDVYRLLGEKEQAERAYREALNLLNELVAAAPQATGYRRDLAAAHNGLAQLCQETERMEEAERQFRAGADLLERLSAEAPGDADFRGQLAVLWNNLGIQFSRQGRLPEAEAAQQKALALRRRLAEEFPEAASFRLDESISLANRAAVRMKMQRPHDALADLRQALQLRGGLPESISAETDFRRATAAVYNNLGSALAATNQPQDAADAYGQAIAALARLAADYPTAPSHRALLADSYTNLGLHEAVRQRPREAAQAFTAALEIWEQLARENPQSQSYRENADRVRSFLRQIRDENALPTDNS